MFNDAESDEPGAPFRAARSLGDPELAAEPDIFGYRLDGDDGFELDGFVLPVRESRLSPFSLSVRFRPESIAGTARILTVLQGGGEMVRIEVGRGGSVLVLLPGPVRLESPTGALREGVTSVLTVSVWPEEEGALVQLFVDGEVLLSELTDWVPGEFPRRDAVAISDEGWLAYPGRAVIAGENGFVGVLDEFGVYFRNEGDEPSPDTGVFVSAMELTHGDKLVYAEGFEGPTVPEEILVSGDAEVESGRLVLASGSSAFFPTFGFGSETLYVTVTLERLAGARARFYADFGSSDAAGYPDTSGGAAATRLQLITELSAEDEDLSGTSLEFVFTHSGETLRIQGPGDDAEEVVLESGDPFVGLRLEVAGLDDEAEVAVESVVAWRERPEIPATLLEPEPEEPGDDS
jgi:hypothetical protein